MSNVFNMFNSNASDTFGGFGDADFNIKTTPVLFDVEQEEGIGVEAVKPIAYCRTIDVPNISFGNTLAVAAIKDVDGNTLKAAQNYTVVNIQADRTGFSALMLEEI